jgi:hypothetical protein
MDKRVVNKKVLGVVDGVNITFMTFEYRRVQNFTTAVFPYGLFINGVQVPTANVVNDDNEDTGVFQLTTTIPGARDTFTATYNYQWFQDSDLDGFLQTASNWLGLTSNYIAIPDGLNPAAIDFAAREAYRSAASKYMTRLSNVFQLEDAPSEEVIKAADSWKEMAQDFLDSAQTMRASYYSRQDQFESPLFALGTGRVRDPVPRR